MDSVVLTPTVENIKPTPICPKCGEYPMFSLLKDNPEKVEMNCPSCSNKEVVLLENLVEFVGPMHKEVSEQYKDKFAVTCEFNKNSCSQIACQYCVDCKLWLCENCKVQHSHLEDAKNHKVDELIPRICRTHKQNYNLYCTKCKVNLCIECSKTHEHKNETVQTAKAFAQIAKYNEFLGSMRKHSNNFVKLFKDIIKMLDDYKNQITEAFNKTCKINQNINAIYRTFIEQATGNKYNYHVLENLEHFGTFSFKRFKFQDTNFNLQNFTGKDLIDYKNYVAEGAMLVEKISSNFEGLQRTKEWTFEHFISALSFYNVPQTNESYFIVGFNNGNLGILKESLIPNKDKLFIAKESHKGRILYIHVNGNFIYTSGFDQFIRKWEIVYVSKSKTYEIEFRKSFRGHRDEVRQVFTVPGTNTLISCSGDDNVIIWEDDPNSLITNPKKNINVDSSITSMLLSKDKKHLVVATYENEIMVYNLDNYQQTCCLEDIYCCSTGCLNYVNDFIVVYGNKILNVFTLQDGKLIRENAKKFDSSDDIRMGISDVMFSIIPVGAEEVILSNLKKSILKINLKNDKIQAKEFSDKENIEGLYHIFSKKYAIVFGKRVEILSN